MADDTPLMADEEAGGNSGKRALVGGGGVAVAGVTLDAAQLPLFLVFVSSIVLLVATGAAYSWKFVTSYSGYALLISVISAVLSLFGLALTRASGDNDVYGKTGGPLNVLIFSYGFLGACFLTFDGPFTTTSNGYFAAWAIVYGSGLAIGMSGLSGGLKGLGSIMGLAASSLILIVAAVNPIRHDYHRDEAVFALVLACVTFAFLLVAARQNAGGQAGPVYFIVLALLAICWIVEASLVTFRGPFTDTGNGYFAR